MGYLPVVRRRTAADLQELPIEIGDVVEADLETYLRDWQMCLGQKRAGNINPGQDEIACKCVTRLPFEHP